MVLDAVRADLIPDGRAVYPKALLLAVAHEALGDSAQGRREYEEALPVLEAEAQHRPGGTPSITEATLRNHGAALSTRRALASTSMPTGDPLRVMSIWG
jgi:hypothetical protein